MKKNMIRLFICMIAVTLLLSTVAFAAGSLDLTKECSIKIDYTYDNLPVVGAEFDLYRVGDLSQEGKLSLSGEFKDYPVVVDGLTNEEFQKAADTLASYAAQEKHVPLAALVTDDNGHVEKSGLEAGLYLLVGMPLKTDGGVYNVENQLVILPYAANTAGEWDYELVLKPKASFTPDTPEPLNLQVVKVWDDKDNGGYYRPKSVTVHLMRNGEKYDSVVLDESNSWRHEWKDLERTYNWSVSEDVPAEYTVAITLEGTKFIVTNTGKTPPPPTPTPPSIPQTGQVWWPVPVLLILGIALVAVGFMWRKEDEA